MRAIRNTFVFQRQQYPPSIRAAAPPIDIDGHSSRLGCYGSEYSSFRPAAEVNVYGREACSVTCDASESTSCRSRITDHATSFLCTPLLFQRRTSTLGATRS